jgi:hypothetical protein
VTSSRFAWEENGSAAVASSKPWGRVFRLPLSAVGWAAIKSDLITLSPWFGGGAFQADLGPAGARSGAASSRSKTRHLFRYSLDARPAQRRLWRGIDREKKFSFPSGGACHHDGASAKADRDLCAPGSATGQGRTPQTGQRAPIEQKWTIRGKEESFPEPIPTRCRRSESERQESLRGKWGVPRSGGAPFKERRRPCALRSGAGLSFPGNHLRHPPFPATFTWDNRLDRLGKGSASVTSSNFWGWMFRLPLSGGGPLGVASVLLTLSGK